MDFAHAAPAKDIVGLTLLVLGILGGVTVTCLSQRAPVVHGVLIYELALALPSEICDVAHVHGIAPRLVIQVAENGPEILWSWIIEHGLIERGRDGEVERLVE
jgi:hypothetical protein